MMFPAPKLDDVTIKPDLSGPRGRAWRCNLNALRKRHGVTKENDGTVALWLIEAPWAHPAWHSYFMVLVHLRPMPDGRETKFYLDGASHELWLYALDPDGNRQKLVEGYQWGPESCAPLTPMNFGAQFIEPTDALAKERCENAVRRICDGTLSPDTDFIRQWMHLFGSNMIRGDKQRAGETRIITAGAEIVIPPQPGPQDMH